MTRIFDALRKAESTREHAAAAAAVTPLPPPPHTGAAVRPFAPSPRPASDRSRMALPLAGSFSHSDEVVREMTTLRVSLEALLGEAHSRSVAFVGPQGGEGTSSIALQFASVVALDPHVRVLIIDAHVRRAVYHADESRHAAVADPRVAGAMYDPSGPTSSHLFAVPAPDDIIRTGLYRPADLRSVLDATTAGFDWVVFDGPPVIESPDSAALAAMADTTVVVLQAGRTKRPVLARSADLLRKSGARLAGSVLNRRVLEIPEFIYRRI